MQSRLLSGSHRVLLPPTRQSLDPHNQAPIGSFAFTKNFLHVPFLRVAEKVSQTSHYEMYCLRAIENKCDEELDSILSETSYPTIIDLSRWPFFAQMKKAEQKELEQMVSLTSPTGLKRKLFTSLTREILTDALKTFVHYGMDPQLIKHYCMNPKQYDEHKEANLWPNDSLRACLM